ncbi:unnamed protein product [Closterium sp. NIES-54]
MHKHHHPAPLTPATAAGNAFSAANAVVFAGSGSGVVVLGMTVVVMMVVVVLPAIVETGQINIHYGRKDGAHSERKEGGEEGSSGRRREGKGGGEGGRSGGVGGEEGSVGQSLTYCAVDAYI